MPVHLEQPHAGVALPEMEPGVLLPNLVESLSPRHLSPRSDSPSVKQLHDGLVRVPSKTSFESGGLERTHSKESHGVTRKEQRATSKLSTLSSISKQSAVVVAVKKIIARKVDPFTVTVTASGALLACCAGMVNVISFHVLSKFVSHLTGTFARSAIRTSSGAWEEAAQTVAIVFAFILGSTVCGCMIAKSTVTFDTPLYGLVLLLNAALLVVTYLTSEQDIAPYLSAMACGLQNGMATSYSGAVIRTTHMTGLATDVGLIVGRVLSSIVKRRLASARMISEVVHPIEELQKLRILLILAVSLFVGFVLGSLLHSELGAEAFLVPAAVTGFCGAYYVLFRLFCPHRAPHHVEAWGDLSPKAASRLSRNSFMGKAWAGRVDEGLGTVEEGAPEAEHEAETDAPARAPAAAAAAQSPRDSETDSVHTIVEASPSRRQLASSSDRARGEPKRAESLQHVLKLLDALEAPIGELSSGEQDRDSGRVSETHRALRERVWELAEAMGVPTSSGYGRLATKD